MKILVACEFSGTVREAFRRKGHDAFSCDILPCELGPSYHYECDIFEVIESESWDLMVAHPPCTHLAVSGARWWKDKKKEQEEAISFVRRLMTCDIPKIAIENPIGILSTAICKPTQIIQPWMFGHGETKATCLWLKNLSPLIPTNIVEGREPRIHRMPPGPNRWKERSRTYKGIAEAMAEQWS